MTTETAITTRSLQIWPAGDSVRISGEHPHYTIHHDQETRPATPEESRRIRIEELAELYADRYIWHVDSRLVEMLMEKENEGFTIDDIRGMYRDFSDSTMEECRDFINDYSSNFPDPDPWHMDREQLAELLTDAGIEVYDTEDVATLRAAVIANMDDKTIDGLTDWRDAANECSQENPQEAYEWYRVDPWLCARLDEIGEITIDNEYGEWWGRSCTGQSLIMDGTLQQIAARYVD